MKIMHIIAGNLDRGAAKGAYWLHQGLIDLGIDSFVWTNSETIIEDDKIVSPNRSKKDKLFNFIRAQLDSQIQVFYPKRKRAIFSSGFFGFDFTKVKEYKEADIIHLHWINGGFVNIKHLSKIAKPMVWTLRDMWPLTGGCHYSMECENYKNGCGKCMQLNSKSSLDLSKIILNRKKKYIPKDLKIIGISQWLSLKAKESEIFKEFDIRTISNNINTRDFFPVEKSLAKKILGLNTNKKIILTGAQNLKDFYKGPSEFLNLIRLLDRDKYFIVFFGKLDKSIVSELDNIGLEYKSFGFLYDSISLRLVYSASDVFVATSLMEAFGKTLAESMACGTPVVCFDATGPKDIVTHKIDGYKARAFEVEDLYNGIKWIVDSPSYNEFSKNARDKVLKEFDNTVIAKKYIKLYEEISNGRRVRGK